MRPCDFDSIEQNNAIYFPFINVPESDEFTQTLLYWDKIYSIVPVNCRENGILNQSMEEYLDAELVTPLRPYEYAFNIPADIYEKLIRQLRIIKPRIERVANRSDMEPVAIHREKLEVIIGPLMDSEIVQQSETEWYLMPRWAAYRVMTVLATALGRMRQFQSAPVTDELGCLNLLRSSSRVNGPNTRSMILRDVLPIPRDKMGILELRDFKRQHRPQLRQFRNLIEEEAIKCNIIEDHEEQQRAIQLAVRRLNQQKEELTGELGIPLRFTSVTALLGAAVSMITLEPIGLAAGAFSLASGIAQIREDRKKPLSNPLAYAALAQRRFSVR